MNEYLMYEKLFEKNKIKCTIWYFSKIITERSSICLVNSTVFGNRKSVMEPLLLIEYITPGKSYKSSAVQFPNPKYSTCPITWCIKNITEAKIRTINDVSMFLKIKIYYVLFKSKDMPYILRWLFYAGS